MPDEREPLLDPSILEEIRASTGKTGFVELIDEFVGEIRRLAGDLSVSQQTFDSNALERAAHELTGMAMTFGALRLGTIARQIMIDCHDDKLDLVPGQVTILLAVIDDTLAAVDSWQVPTAP